MVDPMSLNEAQGLTIEMLRSYVERNQLGIQVRDDLGAELDTLSLLTGRPIQELLREVNPRLIPLQSICVPLEELHPGEWAMYSPYAVQVGVPSKMSRDFPPARFIRVWPLDDNGNKLRWPERDGRMLGIKSDP